MTRRALIAALAPVAAAAAVIVVAEPFGGSGSASAAGQANPAATATVQRGRLRSQVSGTGTLGYVANADGSPWTAVNQAAGAYTSLPSPGDARRCGHVAYRVDAEPVVLLCGRTPLYRTLSEGMSGPDVRELNRNLVRLGYADEDLLDPRSDDFGSRTADALRALQEDLGVDETGTLAPSAAVVLPGRARITKVPAILGTPARPGAPVAQATSTRRQVQVELDASDAATVHAGDRAQIMLPSNATTSGRVSDVGTVAGTGKEDSSASIPVYVTLDHVRAVKRLDEASVEVQITTARVKDALSVPVTALIALAGGGYAVETVAPDGSRRRVPVRLGVFDHADGLVQVTGAGLSEGQKVVVPAT